MAVSGRARLDALRGVTEKIKFRNDNAQRLGEKYGLTMIAEIETLLAEAEKSASNIRDHFVKSGVSVMSVAEIARDPDAYARMGSPTIYHPRFSRFQPETETSLRAIEDALGIDFPSDLRSLLINVGGFYCEIDGEGCSLTFKSRPAYPFVVGGLAEMLEKRWHWDENRAPLAPELIDKMNAAYFCFGSMYVDENTCDHFYFDRQHQYRILRYDQAFSDDDANNHLYELVDGANTRPTITLPEIIIPRLAEACRRLFEYTEMIVFRK